MCVLILQIEDATTKQPELNSSRAFDDESSMETDEPKSKDSEKSSGNMRPENTRVTEVCWEFIVLIWN